MHLASSPPSQIAVTFAIVLGVIIYRISTAAALAMNSSPSVRSNIRVTVTATAVIINLVVIILLDEVYGCIARWLTKIGECASMLWALGRSLTLSELHRPESRVHGHMHPASSRGSKDGEEL